MNKLLVLKWNENKNHLSWMFTSVVVVVVFGAITHSLTVFKLGF